MIARFDDFSFIENIDAIGILDGRKAMGNGNGCPPLAHLLQRVLDHLFRLLVDISSGLIQNEDLRLGSNGPGKSQKLTLTGR